MGSGKWEIGSGLCLQVDEASELAEVVAALVVIWEGGVGRWGGKGGVGREANSMRGGEAFCKRGQQHRDGHSKFKRVCQSGVCSSQHELCLRMCRVDDGKARQSIWQSCAELTVLVVFASITQADCEFVRVELVRKRSVREARIHQWRDRRD